MCVLVISRRGLFIARRGSSVRWLFLVPSCGAPKWADLGAFVAFWHAGVHAALGWYQRVQFHAAMFELADTWSIGKFSSAHLMLELFWQLDFI